MPNGTFLFGLNITNDVYGNGNAIGLIGGQCELGNLPPTAYNMKYNSSGLTWTAGVSTSMVKFYTDTNTVGLLCNINIQNKTLISNSCIKY